jgi:hypothetical protein
MKKLLIILFLLTGFIGFSQKQDVRVIKEPYIIISNFDTVKYLLSDSTYLILTNDTTSKFVLDASIEDSILYDCGGVLIKELDREDWIFLTGKKRHRIPVINYEYEKDYQFMSSDGTRYWVWENKFQYGSTNNTGRITYTIPEMKLDDMSVTKTLISITLECKRIDFIQN